MKTKTRYKIHKFLTKPAPEGTISPVKWWCPQFVYNYIFPQVSWSKLKNWRHENLEIIAEHFGITVVDIKLIGYVYDYDKFSIRTWNHRTFEITGMELDRLRRKNK